jgi:peptide/nickel transport system substrate-binding protein
MSNLVKARKKFWRTKMSKKLFVGFSAVIIFGMVLAACGPAATAAPAASAAGANAAAPAAGELKPAAEAQKPAAPAKGVFKSKDPNTFVSVTIGEPDVLDPALDYETAGTEVNQNVLETLVFYKKESATDFVPMLATDWKISADGLVYTFNIRKDVKFHDGGTLEPTDIAYSLQRAVLQSGSSSPSLLLTEPILGIGLLDASELVDPTGALVDDPAGVQAAKPDILKAACEKVTSKIVADDKGGTVTITLAQPYAPFLSTLAHTVASVLDKEWVIAQTGWDGSCDTWQKFYGITFDNDPIAEKANGTGPYKFVSWDHATKTVTLQAFDGYWRKEPLWEGAKTGVAKIKNVVIKGVDEWGTRFAMMQAGDADFNNVPRSNVTQVDPMVGERADFDVAANKFGELKATSTSDQPLRLWFGVPALTRTDLFMNQQINTPEGYNSFTISGQLGFGIPANFFSDVHIRKAFNYCMNWDAYIKDFWMGEAVRLPYVLSLPGELGYKADAPTYAYDLKKCEEEFKAATFRDDLSRDVWTAGFNFVSTYNSGNAARKAWLDILSAGLKKVNPKFQMKVLALPWASLLHFRSSKQLPFYAIGWQEDIHDPHNWYSPYLIADYGSKLGFPKETMDMFKDYVNRGVAETDPAKRDAIYKELNQKVYDLAPYVIGVLGIGRHYEQRWVTGYYNNSLYGGFYYYELGKN